MVDYWCAPMLSYCSANVVYMRAGIITELAAQNYTKIPNRNSYNHTIINVKNENISCSITT